MRVNWAIGSGCRCAREVRSCASMVGQLGRPRRGQRVIDPDRSQVVMRIMKWGQRREIHHVSNKRRAASRGDVGLCRSDCPVRDAVVGVGLTGATESWYRRVLQRGQRVMSLPVSSNNHWAAVFFSGGSGGWHSKCSRQRARACFLLRLAKKPKWRIRMKPSGNTCCRNRRRNSSVGSDATFRRSLSRRSRYQKRTCRSSVEIRR